MFDQQKKWVTVLPSLVLQQPLELHIRYPANLIPSAHDNRQIPRIAHEGLRLLIERENVNAALGGVDNLHKPLVNDIITGQTAQFAPLLVAATFPKPRRTEPWLHLALTDNSRAAEFLRD